MNTDSFIVYIKANHIYKYMAENIETRFDTWIYDLERPLPKGKNKKVTGLILLIQWSFKIPSFGNLHKIFASYQTALRPLFPSKCFARTLEGHTD